MPAIADIDYSYLPGHMQSAARLYVERGVQPGSFLRAVLANNLVEAFQCADEDNRAAMFYWAKFMHMELPSGSWGSEDKVSAWIAHQGAKGWEVAE